jgi:hypothetical protein
MEEAVMACFNPQRPNLNFAVACFEKENNSRLSARHGFTDRSQRVLFQSSPFGGNINEMDYSRSRGYGFGYFQLVNPVACFHD